MRDTSMTGHPGQARANRTAFAVLACTACLGLLGAPAHADAVDPDRAETYFDQPVSLEDLDNERARFTTSDEGPVDVRGGFAVILMDELGKPIGGGSGSVAPTNGSITLGGSRTN